MSRILVVDDDKAILDLMVLLLRGEGFEVQSAGDGAQALAQMAPPPDLILLDIMLPGMDGWSVLAELKRRAETKAVPVIVCTTTSGREDKARARSLGARDYIHKPFDPHDFIARTKAALAL